MDIIEERYRMDYQAGSGGFGTLYKGYDMHLEREVAIKIVSSVDDREAMVLRELDHKGLPRIYDICRGVDKTYLIMEWVPGTDLEKYIETNGSMEERMVIEIAKELLEILRYLHGLNRQVIYQDLKPANIMIMPNGHIKLVDFGTAFLDSHGDERIVVAGTVGYGAPEQRGIHGARYADERSDIYSWGACVYSLISGRSLNKPPYTMDKPRRVCPQISHGLEKIILKATHRDPERRYRNVSEIVNALNHIHYVDGAYRFAFATAMVAFVLPFVLSWIWGIHSGVFSGIEKVFGLAISNGRTGPYSGMFGLDRSELFKTLISGSSWVTYGGFNDSLCKITGIIMISLAWMFWGLKSISRGKTVKVRKSVYLSEKKSPGLWLCVLLIGIIFGYGLNATTDGAMAYAAEKETTLPVNIIEENGMRTIVRTDAVYYPSGNIMLEIPEQALSDAGEKKLRISLYSGGRETATRTFLMR